jgi:hypothetical protein
MKLKTTTLKKRQGKVRVKPAKKRKNPHQRPDLTPETFEALKGLRSIDDPSCPDDVEDALEWHSLHAHYGKVLHLRLWLVCQYIEAHIQGACYPLYSNAQQQKYEHLADEVLPQICAVALANKDLAFFRHLVEVMEYSWEHRGGTGTSGSEFIKLIEWNIRGLYAKAWRRFVEEECRRVENKEWDKKRPVYGVSWLDVLDMLKSHQNIERFAPGFLARKLDDQRRQIEAALRALGLPFLGKNGKKRKI